MARTVLATFLVMVLVSCGGTHQTLPSLVLRGSGIQKVPLDQAYRDALDALGDKCYQAGTRVNSSATDTPSSVRFGIYSDLQLRQASLHLAGLSGQTSGTSKSLRSRAIHDLEQLAYLDDIEIAQFHSAKNELVVMGPPAEGQTGIRPDDFLGVFRALSDGEAPGVTIDPQSDTRFMQVRYFGHVEDTKLGLSLFEADRLLKLMSTGFDNNNCQRWEGMPLGITTEVALFTDDILTKGNGAVGQAQWHRFWFEFNDEPIERDDEHLAIRIPVNRLAVNEQTVPAGYKSPDSALSFAGTLSNKFLTLTRSLTPFRDVQRAAAVTSLAKWVIDKQIPVEREWLSSQPAFTSTPTTTPRISVTRTLLQGDRLIQAGIEGGVDFQKPNNYRSNPAAVEAILRAADASAQPRTSTWDFTVQGKAYRAVRLPYLHPIRLRPQTTTWYRTVRIGMPRPRVLDVRIPVGKLSISNKTSGPLNLSLSGPKADNITIPSALTQDIGLVPGTYEVAVTSGCGQLKDSISVSPGERYSASYACEPVRPAPPVIPRVPEHAPTTGKLTIENFTGGNITIQVFGVTTASYAAPIGSSTFDLPIGSYSISASTRCGTTTDSFSITPRGVTTETYSCVLQ